MKNEVNNHVHTCFSFSPYTPTQAAQKAVDAGLLAVGIMDHDSVAGCREMLNACKELGIASTCGFELRVDMTGTAVEGRKTNNPDTPNNSYMAIHGIPKNAFYKAADFLKPIQKARIERNRKQTKKLNILLKKTGLPILDFDSDIVRLSKIREGGSMTERHILYALSLSFIEQFGKGDNLVHAVREKLDIAPSKKQVEQLTDPNNPHYAYDLLGVFKSTLVPRFFIQPDHTECPPIQKAVDFALSIGAIPAYAYLGDVGKSPTGDKKTEKFEDEYLNELIPELKRLGFKAVTYMPPRNTLDQLLRLQKLCTDNDLVEISGVDINSSRQSFNCPEIQRPEFHHLIDATWALIAHEKLATHDPKLALFSPKNPFAHLGIKRKLEKYSAIGKNMDHRNPENVEGIL